MEKCKNAVSGRIKFESREKICFNPVTKSSFPQVSRLYPNDYLYSQGAQLYIYDPKEGPELSDAAYTVLRLLERAHKNYQRAVKELKENTIFDNGFWTVAGFTDFVWAGIVTFQQPVVMDDRWFALDKYTRFLRFTIKGSSPIAVIDRRVELYGACYTIRAFQFDDDYGD
jgi:hypothetical protein